MQIFALSSILVLALGNKSYAEVFKSLTARADFLRYQSVEIDATLLDFGEIEHKNSIKKMALSAKLLNPLQWSYRMTHY